MSESFCEQCGRRLKTTGEECPECRGDDMLFCPECEDEITPEDTRCSFCGLPLFTDHEKRETKKRERRVADEKQEELVCVKSTVSRMEAEMVAAMLDSYGIWSLVKADDAGGWRPHMLYGMPAEVLVRRADEKTALELLRTE